MCHIRVQHGFVGAGREAGQAAPLVEDVIADREERGGVVEHDVAGERRRTGQQYRRADRQERGHGGSGRMNRAADSRKPHHETGSAEPDRQRRGEGSRRARERRQARDHDQQRHAARGEQGRGHARPGHALEQQPGPKRERRQHDREDDPANEQRQHREAPGR